MPTLAGENLLAGPARVTARSKYLRASLALPETPLQPARGAGYLAGKLSGAAPDPATIRILYRGEGLGDGALVVQILTSPTGDWRVDNLNPTLRYDVVARRAGFNDVITADVQPLPML